MSTTDRDRTVHLLTRAAQIIDRNGLAPDVFVQPVVEDGAERPPEECPVCPRGAIALAAGKHPEYMSEDMWAEGGSPWERDPVAAAEIIAAEKTLAGYLIDELGWRSRTRETVLGPLAIEAWIDEGASLPQVVGAMRAAALGAATERARS